MRIALTGATGFVGGAVLSRALAEGCEVTALTRKPQQEQPGVAWISGDLDNAGALARLVGEADIAIHVAGAINAAGPAEFERCNVTGTLNVIEAARKAGIGRFVFVSSLAAREPSLSQYGASKARAEKLVMASGLDWTIVRPPAVYGPRDRELFELFRAAKWGIVPTPKQGRTSLIHVDDLSRLLIAMPRGDEEVTGRTFEPDDGMPAGWDHFDLALAIGFAIGRRPKVLGLSRKALDRAASIDRMFRGARAKMTPDRAAYFSHPDWVVSRGAVPPRKVWTPKIETREGLKATAQWYREAGWL